MNQLQSRHAHTATPAEEEKERSSDSSSHGGQDPMESERLDPVTGKPVQSLDGDKVELTEEDCYDELVGIPHFYYLSAGH